jgi:hypothetical protein
MINGFIALLQNDDVVSNGFYFKAVVNWWDVGAVVIIIAFLIYLRKRKK